MHEAAGDFPGPTVDGGRCLWLGVCRSQLPGLQSGRGKKSVGPKPEENLLCQCQEAVPHLPAVTCCCPCLEQHSEHPLALRAVEGHHCETHVAAVGVRASGRITALLGDGGSEFKGEISDAGCDHPFSPLLPTLTLVRAVFSARTSFWASLLLHCVPQLWEEFFSLKLFRDRDVIVY